MDRPVHETTLDGTVCDAAEVSVDAVPLLADTGKHVLNDDVNDTGLSTEDGAPCLVTPKVVVESVSKHYQKFDHIPSVVVRRPQQMQSILLSMDQQLGLIDFIRSERPDTTAPTLTSAVQFVEDNFCVKASLSLVRSVLKRNNICLPESVDQQSPTHMNDDDEQIQATTKAEHRDVGDFNAAVVDVSGDENNPTVAEIMQDNDIQLPVGEETSLSLVVPLRRSSRRRRTLNREQQHELTRVAKQCNAAAVRKLKSYANTKFNVDLPDQVIGSLLVRHNKGYSDMRTTRFRNSRTINRGSSPSDEPVTKIIRDERTDSSDTVDDGDDHADGDQNCSGQTKDSLLNDSQQDSGSGSHPARKHLKFSNMVRRTVVQLVCVNKISHAQVGKLLGIPKGTVSTIVRVFKNHDRIDKIKKGGSCPKLTDVQQDTVAKYVEDNPGVTTDRIREYVQETFGVSVTRTTVQKLLKKHNLALRKSHLSFVRYLNNEFYEEPQVETVVADTKSESIGKSLLITELAVKGSVGSTDVGGSGDEPQAVVGGRQKKKYASMSNYIRHKIVEFVVRWGMSHAKVGDLLGVPKGTVSGVVRCFQQNNRINKIKHGGAHCKLTKEHQDALVKYVAENDELTIKQAIDYVKQLSGKQVSKNLVYNILRKHNLHKRKKGPVWPEWYLANKEHVVELPATKLLMVNNCARLSKRNPPTNPSPASPTGKLRIVTDDEASEQEMLTTGMYSQSSDDGPDPSAHDHRLTDTSLIGSCGDHDKLPYNYLDDQDSILLQQVQGLFAAVAASTQVDVKSADCSASNLDMPSTTANQVEVSTTPPEEPGFVGATGGVFADSTVNGKPEAVEDSSAKKQKKRYVPLSNVDRQRVISCVVHKGLSHAVVSKLFDIPRGTVSSIMRCFQKNSRIEKIRKGGSPSKLSGEQQRLMVDYHEQRGKLSIKQLQNYCHETFGVSVSKSTVSLILKRHCSPLKKK